MEDELPATAARALRHVAGLVLDGPPVDETARVALHFHPDFDLRGEPVLRRILDDGAYLSQFATGTSNGGLTVDGGDRQRWEHRLFGGAYDDAERREHPVYGALMLETDASYGPASRFGSSFLRLRAESMQRTTFTYPDSAAEPTSFGVAGRMGLLELLHAAEVDDPLDRYIEAHVHGGIRVPGDVEALVLDPSFAGAGLEDAARAAGIAVEWHPGYEVTVQTIAAHVDYRGADTVDLARRLADDRPLTPATLGRWRGRADVDPQLLKYVWHYLARFGRRDEPFA